MIPGKVLYPDKSAEKAGIVFLPWNKSNINILVQTPGTAKTSHY